MATQELTNLSKSFAPKVGTVIGRNARGGINKVSNREAAGAVPLGSTGAVNSLQLVPSAITPADLAPAPSISLPNTPTPTDTGALVSNNNATLAPALGYTIDQNGVFVPPTTETTTTDPNQGFSDIFGQYMAKYQAPSNTADIYSSEYKNAGIEDKQKLVNNLTGKLNSITNNAQAAQLKLEQTNSGNDVSKNVFFGQQARINREAAIAALPIQAQLSAAQGDLAMAQEHLDTMFKIKSEDAKAQYEYRNKVLDAVYDFATAAEQRKLDSVQKAEDRKYKEDQDFLSTQRTLLSSAMQQGAPASVIQKINSATSMLDVISAAGAYNGDILSRQIKQAQLRELNTPSGDTTKWDIKSVNGTDMLFNPATGETKPIGGTAPDTKTQQVVDSLTDKITNLKELMDSPGLDSSVGPNKLSRDAFAVSDSFGAKQNFLGRVSQLTSKETLDGVLSLKKAGGTLGALNETEGGWLKDAATSINSWAIIDPDTKKVTGYNIDEKNFKVELQRLIDLSEKARVNALGYDPTLLPTEDSSIIDLYVGGQSTAAFNPSSYY
jgi:hypothetical protein